MNIESNANSIIKSVQYLVYLTTRTNVELYRVDTMLSGVGDGDSFQIMLENKDEDKYRQFWTWHSFNNPQYFRTPVEAASSFVKFFLHWKENKDQLILTLPESCR